MQPAPGGHLERDRGVPGERPARRRRRRRPERGASGGRHLHRLLPAEQAAAHHAPGHRGALRQPAAQLPARRLRPRRPREDLGLRREDGPRHLLRREIFGQIK
ncbi:hypothetical protein CRUP_010425, partial [Coryphaenoides rupestris]